MCASVFLLGFTALGIPVDNTGMWIMTCILGLFIVKHVLTGAIDGEYGELFWETAIAWGFWILLAVAREFFGAGTIFENSICQAEFQSKIFQDTMFGFLTAGMTLAFTNGVLKKKSANTHSLLLVIPLAVFMRPFTMESFGALLGQIWTIAVPVILFMSVKVTLKFARTEAGRIKAFRWKCWQWDSFI